VLETGRYASVAPVLPHAPSLATIRGCSTRNEQHTNLFNSLGKADRHTYHLPKQPSHFWDVLIAALASRHLHVSRVSPTTLACTKNLLPSQSVFEALKQLELESGVQRLVLRGLCSHQSIMQVDGALVKLTRSRCRLFMAVCLRIQ
jgi:hypothetical protein